MHAEDLANLHQVLLTVSPEGHSDLDHYIHPSNNTYYPTSLSGDCRNISVPLRTQKLGGTDGISEDGISALVTCSTDSNALSGDPIDA